MLISTHGASAGRVLHKAAGPTSTASAAKIRAVRLYATLQASGELSIQTLTRQLQVTPRMLRRDIQAIRAAGCPVKYVRKSGAYQITGGRFLPPLDLTTKEAISLLVLKEHIQDDPVLAKAAREALIKIRSHLPGPLQQMMEPRAGHISVRPVAGESPGADHDIYCKMDNAIRGGWELVCRYEAVHTSRPAAGLSDGDGKFIFRPYHLMFSNRAWYVIGRWLDRKELRTLKLIRFTAVERTGKRYRVPRSFSLAKYLGDCWRMIPSGKVYQVRLHVDAEFAGSVTETQWHGTQKCDQLANGQVMLSFQVDGLGEIVWWILGLGPHCQVLAPRELVEKVRDLAAQTAALYAGAKEDGAAEKDFQSYNVRVVGK